MINPVIHVLAVVFWTICAFETGRLFGRMSYRKQIRMMKRQLEQMIEQLEEAKNGK